MGRAYEVRKASIAKTGAAKSKLYSIYAKDIYITAKNGGIYPESNQNLKRLLEKAKNDQVPNDIIKRAIDKVNSGVQENYDTLRYEGFGPGGATIIVDCLTDNVNRTISYIRGVFSKAKAKLGNSGSVSYLYDNYCILEFTGLTEEEVLNILIDNEIDIKDIEIEDDNIVLYGDPTDIHRIKNAIINYKNDIIFTIDEIAMIPQQKVKLNNDDLIAFKKLIQLLEDIEDVQKIYYNVENM
jgi:YebC/PmpR family DNA-binding regulatory protein